MKVLLITWALLSLANLQGCTAFVTPSKKVSPLANRAPVDFTTTTCKAPFVKTTPRQTPHSSLGVLPPNLVTAAVESVSNSAASTTDLNPLLLYFLETLISNGIPALFTIIVLAFAGNQLRSARGKRDLEYFSEFDNPAARLYNDLYGNPDKANDNLGGFFLGGGGGGGFGRRKLPRNLGVPEQEYLTLKHLNQIYDSYRFSINAATQSKAQAAAVYRQSALERALFKVLPTNGKLEPAALQRLSRAEQVFLREGALLVETIQRLQTLLTRDAMSKELSLLGLQQPYDLVPKQLNGTATVIDTTSKPSTKKDNTSNDKRNAQNRGNQLQALSKAQRDLQLLELKFIQEVLQIVGPEYAPGIRAAILGDVAARGVGGLLSSVMLSSSSNNGVQQHSNGISTVGQRPLARLLSNATDATLPRLYVTRFPGDATASQVANLREEVTAIVRNAQPGDEALVVLQTGGGTVTGYGLAAAQLLRLKDAGLRLTIAVEQVAASGGYMLACVADYIVASPFAVLGSIGVISDIPNVYERLKKEGIEFQTVTAGKYKRTITPTKQVTKEDLDKTKQDIEDVLTLFKGFVAANRPQLNIDEVATGETWFGEDALKRNLCDELRTVDAVIGSYIDRGYDVFEVAYSPPLKSRFGSLVPAGSADINDENTGFIQRGIRWLVQTIASELQREMDITNHQSVEKRYMASSDVANRIRVED